MMLLNFRILGAQRNPAKLEHSKKMANKKGTYKSSLKDEDPRKTMTSGEEN